MSKKCLINIIKEEDDLGPLTYVTSDQVRDFRFMIDPDDDHKRWNVYRQYRMGRDYGWQTSNEEEAEMVEGYTLAIALAAYHLGQISRA